MLKTNKNIRVLKFLIKILLFFIVFWLFFNQIERITWDEWNTVRIQHFPLLLLAISLVFVNWGLEFVKWNLTLKTAQISSNRPQKIKAFLAGIVTGLLTPNLLGNFIGRLFYFQRRDRSAIILLTLFSNGAQFLASILFGIIAIYWLGFPEKIGASITNSYGFVSFFLLLLVVLAYFYFEHLPLIRSRKQFQKLALLFKNDIFFRFKLLLLSLLRHLVFSIQYVLVLKSVGITVDLSWMGWIWQVFFWSTLVPSLWMGKLFVRESIALLLLAPLTTNSALVLISSISLWILNQVIPALIGIPFLGKKKSV